MTDDVVVVDDEDIIIIVVDDKTRSIHECGAANQSRKHFCLCCEALTCTSSVV